LGWFAFAVEVILVSEGSCTPALKAEDFQIALHQIERRKRFGAVPLHLRWNYKVLTARPPQSEYSGTYARLYWQFFDRSPLMA
jgi:hypothetical protein